MENNLIVKHNNLIQARYNLNLNEQKIILYAVSKLDREREKFNLLSLEIREFFDLLGTTQERYTEIKEVVKELRKKEIIIKKDGNELIVGWLSSIEYLTDEGKIELEFSEKLMPYLLQLKQSFTRYQLENILYLKNKHSIRIYELMKQYEKIGKREFKLDELRSILDINNDEYLRFDNFDRVVLVKSKKEINMHTDLMIDYEKIKTGRKITSILFKINPKITTDAQYIKYLDENYNIAEIKTMSGLENEKLNSKQVMDLYEISVNKTDDENVNPFEYIKLNYLLMIEKKTVRNNFAYLKKALENDYALAIGQLKFDIEI